MTNWKINFDKQFNVDEDSWNIPTIEELQSFISQAIEQAIKDELRSLEEEIKKLPRDDEYQEHYYSKIVALLTSRINSND